MWYFEEMKWPFLKSRNGLPKLENVLNISQTAMLLHSHDVWSDRELIYRVTATLTSM